MLLSGDDPLATIRLPRRSQPNRGEGIVSRKPRPKSAHDFLGLLYCFIVLLPVGLPRSGQIPVLNLLTGQKSGFSPRRGDSLHRFRSNFAGLTGTWVRLAVQNFTSIATGGGNAAPKCQKFPLFGKDSLDRFPMFLGAFITIQLGCRSLVKPL